MPARPWTPAQAGYRHDTLSSGSVKGGGLVREFILCRHGIVARTWMSPTFVEVALRRPSQTGGTYQGSVELTREGWTSFDPAGEVVARGVDYVEAEAPLLRVRTGQRAAIRYDWPRELVDQLKKPTG